MQEYDRMGSSAGSAICPTIERLEDYRAGLLAAQNLTSIASHLSACPRCQEWLADAAANDDLMVGLRPVLDRPPRATNGSSANRSSSGRGWLARVAPNDGPPSIRGYQIIGKLGEGGMGTV